MADITEPINLDSTQKEISRNTKNIARFLGVMASDKMKAEINSWDALAQLVKTGNRDVLDVGDSVVEPWIDTADSNKSYDFGWRVIDNSQSFEDAQGNTFDGLFFEMKYASPFGVQFSHQSAMLACPNGLPAGTYHFTLGHDWGTYVKKDKTYQFTLTKDVEKGGRVAGCYGMPDQVPSNWRIYTYKADRITQVETGIVVSEGSAGTDLGTMAYDTHTDGISLMIGDSTYTVDMNSIQETAYGHNRWKTSALRQYLNSDKGKGLWWTPQEEFDLAPDQLATKDGFLCGVPVEMLNAVKNVKVTTYANTVQDGGAADVTYDKFFPLSLEQMYINPQVAGEGEATAYYKQLNGTASKYQQWQTYKDLIKYAVENHTAAQSLRLRSADRTSAFSTWLVNSSGIAVASHASFAHRFAPACVIG